MARNPILWEEDERFQRGIAYLISALSVLFVVAYGAYCVWRGDWLGARWLGGIVGAVILGLAAWSILVWLLSRFISGTVTIVRGWQFRRREKGDRGPT